MTSQAILAALQAALAAENAAIYGYGVAGAHMTGTYSEAYADSIQHEVARDKLVTLIAQFGGQPRPAAVAYRLPITVRTPGDAVALAASLERQVAAAYLGLVAVPDDTLRTFAAGQMQDAAVRAVRWTGTSQAFPGLSAG